MPSTSIAAPIKASASELERSRSQTVPTLVASQAHAEPQAVVPYRRIDVNPRSRDDTEELAHWVRKQDELPVRLGDSMMARRPDSE